MNNFETPVLFMIFNRLENTQKVFSEIRKIKPKKLFISSDGPRNRGEKKIVNSIREFILENIDWKCEVKTLFHSKNLGCGIACSSAITWFFENIEQGIVLEDDCLPNQDFFRFCQEMLEKYKDNPKIMHISGDNFINNKFSKDSYYFTKSPFLWGWATWRTSWKGYDFNSYKKITSKKIKKVIPNIFTRNLFLDKLKKFKNSGANSWDIQLVWEIKNSNGLCICPNANLVENLGFSSENSTHTLENFWDKFFLKRKRQKINFPLKHPLKIKVSNYFIFKLVVRDFFRVFLKRMSKIF